MKNIKFIIAAALIATTNFAHAGSSSNSHSEESSQVSACMIPIQTSRYYQFLNVSMIRHVRVEYANPTMLKIRHAENTGDSVISIEYKTKEEAIAGANKIVELINNCGKKK